MTQVTLTYDLGTKSGRAWWEHDRAWQQYKALKNPPATPISVALKNLRETLQSEHLTMYSESRIRLAISCLEGIDR